MAFKMKNGNLGKATKQAGKPESRRTESPVKFDWNSMMDKAGTALTGAGMIPVVGNVADAANTALSAGRAGYAKYKGDDKTAKKHAADAAINAAAMIPGAGLAVGAGKLAAKGARAIKGADAVADVAKVAKATDKTADAAKLSKAEKADIEFPALVGKISAVKAYGQPLGIHIVLGIIEEFIKRTEEMKKDAAMAGFDETVVQDTYDRVNMNWNNRNKVN